MRAKRHDHRIGVSADGHIGFLNRVILVVVDKITVVGIAGAIAVNDVVDRISCVIKVDTVEAIRIYVLERVVHESDQKTCEETLGYWANGWIAQNSWVQTNPFDNSVRITSVLSDGSLGTSIATQNTTYGAFPQSNGWSRYTTAAADAAGLAGLFLKEKVAKYVGRWAAAISILSDPSPRNITTNVLGRFPGFDGPMAIVGAFNDFLDYGVNNSSPGPQKVYDSNQLGPALSQQDGGCLAAGLGPC